MKKPGELKNRKELENINKDDLLLSYDVNSLNPSRQIDLKSTWPKIETVHPLKKYMTDVVYSLYKKCRW